MQEEHLEESVPPLVTRWAIGMLFLVAGLRKFFDPGPAVFMEKIVEQFQETILSQILLRPYGYCLPFIEVALGLFLVVGLYRRTALMLTALLLLSLAFGQLLLGKNDQVGSIFIDLLLTAWALMHSRHDRFHLDHLLSR